MFNLGTKEVVINSNANVTEVAKTAVASGIITIAGFGSFTIPLPAAAAARVGVKTVSALPVAGVYTITPTAYDDTKTYDLQLTVRSSRQLSDVNQGVQKILIQSKAGSGSAGASFAAGQIAGFNTNFVKITGTATVIVTFQAGYECLTLEAVEIRDARTEAALVIATAITTAPSVGVGLGKQIEEEVQNATFENLDPYGSKGGNETVDVRGRYTEITWTCVAEDDDSPGWAPHEMLGTGDVNAAVAYAPRTFTAYVNEASAAATITLLNKLVVGEVVP